MIIKTRRLFIQPPGLQREVLRKQVEWLNDPTTMMFSEQRHRKHTLNTQVQYISSITYPHKIWEVFHGGVLVGTMTAYVDLNNGVADIGILIGKEHWGKGYGKEAWAGVCNDLGENGIRKVEAGCMGANYGMIRICRSFEMEEEGRRKDHFLIGKEYSDLVMFGKKL